MVATMRVSSADLQDERPIQSGWLPLFAAFLAGAAVVCLARAESMHSGSVAPAVRQPAPPAARSAPPNQVPYVPPIRIGSSEEDFSSGATAPFAMSAALRRNGEAS
jgi:hypothetical protein